MNIDINSPIIKYAQKGNPFNYERIFINTVSDYIFEYKNVPYDRLTDKDKSVSLARIIKKMEVNGVPVQEFFSAELEEWRARYEDSSRVVTSLVNTMSRDIFGFFDPNMETEQGSFCTDRLYAINNDGDLDYIIYQDEVKKGLFRRKNTEPTEAHKYFAQLLDMCQKDMLPKKSNYGGK